MSSPETYKTWFPLISSCYTTNKGFILVSWSLSRTEDNIAVSYCHRTVSHRDGSFEQLLPLYWSHKWKAFMNNQWCFLISSVMLQHYYYTSTGCLYAFCIPQAGAKRTEDAAYSEGDYFYNNSAVSKVSTHNIKQGRIRFFVFPVPSEINSKLPWPQLHAPPHWKKITLQHTHSPIHPVHIDLTC